ncbi:uncharacterized protein [Oryza sativa Japonica Group]|uniref:uncharacterized protein n=1 Tax=Oryza sativa subsp. japonica TaxID=39947 RepID=UPI000224A9DF|nr:hypothetical protein EE612_025500 [Oryza sativa]
MARKNRDGRVAVWLMMVFLLLSGSYQCEARALMRRSRRNTLLNALYKLNFIRTVEPMQLPSSSPSPAKPDGDAASLADATGDGSSSPYCVNPPNAPPSSSTPTTTPTPTPPFASTPFAPDDQPPPLPPIGGFTPPSFEPSPPASSTPGFTPSTPGSAPPSPIFVVPSPPETGPGGGGLGGGSGGEGGGGVGGGSGGEGGGGGGVGGGPGGGGSGGEGGGGGGSSGGGGSNGGGGSSGGGGNSGGGGGGGGFLPPIVYPPPLAPPAAPGAGEALWCVAKPTVPDPIMQEAMDYACGSGAECGSIQPSGACYTPDTVLAHASYAFNSYWQMTKAAGGTCDFGGTATIVTRDPSYEKCQFDLL